jgi:uncharacterized phage protein (TIGR01671 family)
MREIKFRVWNKDKKEWERHSIGMGTDGVLITNHNEDFELNQFTGLKDKKEREIYEGDIVLLTSKNYMAPPSRMDISWTGRIEFNKYRWALVGEEITKFVTLDDILRSNMEIIGNIYENPELIK